MITFKSIKEKASKNNLYAFYLSIITKEEDIEKIQEDYLRNIFIVSDYNTTKELKLYNCIVLEPHEKDYKKNYEMLCRVIFDIQNAIFGEINIYVALDMEEKEKAEQLTEDINKYMHDKKEIYIKAYFTRLTDKPLKQVVFNDKEFIYTEMETRIRNPHNDFKLFNTKHYLKEFKEPKQKDIISSGYIQLDNLLNGGFYSGFYVIGAVSSLGKTSFCLNIANELARKGNPIIFYSLEMARENLIARSIASEQFFIQKNNYRYFKNMQMQNSFSIAYNKNNCRSSNEYVSQAIKSYEEQIADNIFIVENEGATTLNQIKIGIEDYIRTNEEREIYKKPIIFIDYLQIIAPIDTRLTAKQNMDSIIVELSKFARRNNLIIIGISSLNRESYTREIDMASFKETGAIEYCADIVLGLEYKFMKDLGENEKDRRRKYTENMKKIRELDKIEITLTLLKQREGKRGEISLLLYPEFAHIEENPEGDFIDDNKQEKIF